MLMGLPMQNGTAMKERIKIGLVRSLDALPLIQSEKFGSSLSSRLSVDQDKGAGSLWTTVSCQGYSFIIHRMINGALQGGLVPFDVFAVHMLGSGQDYRRWALLGVHVKCSWEFLVSHQTHSYLAKTNEVRKPALTNGEMRIAMGGHHPIVRLRVERWMKKQQRDDLTPTYHVLPVKLMPQAIMSGVMDAAAMPAPWGYAAQHEGVGMVEPTLEQNGWDLGMMLVVDRQAVRDLPQLLSEMTAVFKKVSGKTTKISQAEEAQLLVSGDLHGGVSQQIMLEAMGSAAASQPMTFEVPPEHVSSRLTLLAECGLLDCTALRANEVAASLLRGLR